MLSDCTQEMSTSIGIGNFTVAGAPLGKVTFANTIGTGNTCPVKIQNALTGEWEISLCQLINPTTLSRLSVYSNYLGTTSFIDFGPGTKDVFVTAPAAFLSSLGGGNDKNYIHNQNSAATVWNVSHGLNKRASVMVVDSGGTQVIGDTQYLDDNNITLTFSAAFSGKAYIN